MLIAHMDWDFSRKYDNEGAIVYSSLIQNRHGSMFKNMAILVVHNPDPNLVTLKTNTGTDSEQSPVLFNIKGSFSFHVRARDQKLPVIHANNNSGKVTSLLIDLSNQEHPRDDVKFFIENMEEFEKEKKDFIAHFSSFTVSQPSLAENRRITIFKNRLFGILPFGSQIVAVKFNEKHQPMSSADFKVTESGLES